LSWVVCWSFVALTFHDVFFKKSKRGEAKEEKMPGISALNGRKEEEKRRKKTSREHVVQTFVKHRPSALCSP